MNFQQNDGFIAFEFTGIRMFLIPDQMVFYTNYWEPDQKVCMINEKCQMNNNKIGDESDNFLKKNRYKSGSSGTRRRKTENNSHHT